MKKLPVVFLLLILGFGLGTNSMDPVSVWREFQANEGEGWRVRFTDRHTVASLYGVSKATGASADAASADFLQDYHPMLGIDRLSDLRLTRMEESPLGHHFYYQQYFSGLRVVGGEVEVHVNSRNQIIAANSSYQHGLFGSLNFKNDLEEARRTAIRILKNQAIASSGELMVLSVGNRPQPVWRIEVDPTKLSEGSWEVYVDATNPKLALRAVKTHASFTGKGNIFLENPAVTPAITSQSLEDMDGSKALAGAFVKVHDANFNQDVPVGPITLSDYTTATEPSRIYNYLTSDPRFTEVMGYFHIGRVHDQWQSVGFNKLNKRVHIFVNVAEEDGGNGFDNAFYTRSAQFRDTGILVFGAGNELQNLGRDADVYYHEYAHDVLDRTKPAFFLVCDSNYPLSFHEGFADTSSAAITGNSKLAEFALRIKATKQFVGRNLENHNRFPENVILPGTNKSEVHFTGLIFGGAWWDLQQVIGAQKAQQILFRSLNLIPNNMTFFDARDAMLTADNTLNAGANHSAIETAFSQHGITGPDPGQPGTLTVTGLKTARFNPNTGNLQPKTTFKKGDTIVILMGYKASGLTPGYNLVFEGGSLSGPPSSNISAFGFCDEVVNGMRTGTQGAIQVVVFTEPTALTGTYTVRVRSRLGGTSQTSPEKTIKFKIIS